MADVESVLPERFIASERHQVRATVFGPVVLGFAELERGLLGLLVFLGVELFGGRSHRDVALEVGVDDVAVQLRLLLFEGGSLLGLLVRREAIKGIGTAALSLLRLGDQAVEGAGRRAAGLLASGSLLGLRSASLLRRSLRVVSVSSRFFLKSARLENFVSERVLSASEKAFALGASPSSSAAARLASSRVRVSGELHARELLDALQIEVELLLGHRRTGFLHGLNAGLGVALHVRFIGLLKGPALAEVGLSGLVLRAGRGRTPDL